MDTARRKRLYRLSALVALSFGSMAALLAKFGDTYTLQIALMLWVVLFLGDAHCIPKEARRQVRT
jgi:predicted signal transduction protein with EAL and GGDEF domain